MSTASASVKKKTPTTKKTATAKQASTGKKAAAASAPVRARVIVYPRPEVLDPQGKAIRAALARIGFEQVVDVRAGKSFDVELAAAGGEEAGAALEEMCQRLLANPLIESYEIELPGEVSP